MDSLPQTPQQPVSRTNGLATASMVLGIIALVFAFIPFLNLVITLPTGILAVIFGGVGYSKSKKLGGLNKGYSIAGLVTGLVSLSLWVYMLVAIDTALSTSS